MALSIQRPSFPPKQNALGLWRAALGLTGAQVAQQIPCSRSWVEVIESAAFPWAHNDEIYENFCASVEALYHRKVRDAENAARELARVEAGKVAPEPPPSYRSVDEAEAILNAQGRGGEA